MLVDVSNSKRPLPEPYAGLDKDGWTVIGIDWQAGVCVREFARDLPETDEIEYTYQTVQTEESIDAVLDHNKANQARSNDELKRDALSDAAVVYRIPTLMHRKITNKLGPLVDGNEADWKKLLNDSDFRHLRTDPSRRL